MNEFQRRLMDKPDLRVKADIFDPGYICPFCRINRATEKHHIVHRSQGGKEGPIVQVCGFGNAGGCHGLLHQHKLHLDWDNGWVYARTKEPAKDVWLETRPDLDWREVGNHGA